MIEVAVEFGKGQVITYFLREPAAKDRLDLAERLMAGNIGQASRNQLLELLALGLDHLADGGEVVATYQDGLKAHRERLTEWGEAVTSGKLTGVDQVARFNDILGEDRSLLARCEAMVITRFRPYDDQRLRNEVFAQAHGRAAAGVLLERIDAGGKDVPVADLIDHLPDSHLAEISAAVIAALDPDEQEKKSSGRTFLAPAGRRLGRPRRPHPGKPGAARRSARPDRAGAMAHRAPLHTGDTKDRGGPRCLGDLAPSSGVARGRWLAGSAGLVHGGVRCAGPDHGNSRRNLAAKGQRMIGADHGP